MTVEPEVFEDLKTTDEAYFDDSVDRRRSFDAGLLQEPITLLPSRPPLVFEETASVKDAMQAMQRRHRGCVVITEDGTARTRLIGIFTERDVLRKVIESGIDTARLPLRDVMTADPEALTLDARLAWALNMMSVGGFRHLPITNDRGEPAFVVSVRDIVEFLVESFPSEILNLPPDFGQHTTTDRDGA